MNLKHLSNVELLNRTFTLAANERKISTQILYHLEEVERRKAYAAKYKCRSLREYAIQILKYSEGSADRRIAAMYALRKKPELASKIESGAMNVTNIARVETFIRKGERISGEKMPEEQKVTLFEQLENTSYKKLESLLMEISPEAAVREGSRPVAKGLHEVRLYLSSEELQKFETLQGWLAHGLKNPGSHSELLVKLISIAEKQILKEKTEEPKRVLKSKENDRNDRLDKENVESTSSKDTHPKHPQNIKPKHSDAPPLTGELRSQTEKEQLFTEKTRPFIKETRSRYIPASVERKIFKRSGLRCEWTHPQTKTRCNSTFKPQVHHDENFAWGGSHDAKNLLLYCADHNRMKAYEDFGFRKMNRFQRE